MSPTDAARGADEPDVILLEGIMVPAALGVTEAEREMRRPVRIDLEVERRLGAAGESDALEDTVDYGEIYLVVESIAGGRDHHLCESLAEEITAALIDRFAADRVTVTIRKSRPIAGVLDYAGVRITRRRAS